MKHLILAAALASIAFGAIAAPSIKNDQSAVHASFGKGQQGSMTYAFATNHGSKPRTLKAEIFKEGAFNSPSITGTTITANGKSYNLIETNPASVIAPKNTVLFPVPNEAGEYAVRMTISDDGMVKKGKSVTSLSSVQTITVGESKGGQQ